MTVLGLVLAIASFANNVTGTIDGGGGRSSGGSYVNDASIGIIGGGADSGIQTNRAGYIGQLTEVGGLVVTGTPAQVNETGTSQLSGAATMSDDTVTVLTGTDINWSYTPLYRTNLAGGAGWTNLLTTTLSDDGTERTLTDTNAVGNARFYRIQITYP
jgi:hypothetical protein